MLGEVFNFNELLVNIGVQYVYTPMEPENAGLENDFRKFQIVYFQVNHVNLAGCTLPKF